MGYSIIAIVGLMIQHKRYIGLNVTPHSNRFNYNQRKLETKLKRNSMVKVVGINLLATCLSNLIPSIECVPHGIGT